MEDLKKESLNHLIDNLGHNRYVADMISDEILMCCDFYSYFCKTCNEKFEAIEKFEEKIKAIENELKSRGRIGIEAMNELYREMERAYRERRRNWEEGEMHDDSFWSCDICGGGETTGCLYFDPTECPRS
jgi:predicted nucleic acid-binding Zn ribbon protein